MFPYTLLCVYEFYRIYCLYSRIFIRYSCNGHEQLSGAVLKVDYLDFLILSDTLNQLINRENINDTCSIVL